MSADWGRAHELSPMETLMWRAEADPAMRSTVVAVEILDRLPEWERLVAAHEWAGSAVPRFRDRIEDPLAPLGTPHWVGAGPLDLRYHLRRVRLAEPSFTELLDFASRLAMAPFDRTRPPWEAVLVDGLSEGRAAYVLKLHHALTDGMGLAQLLSLVHSRRREHDPNKPVDVVPVIAAPGSAVAHLAHQVRRDTAALVPALGAGAGLLVRGLRSPRDGLRSVTEYLGSARRVLAPPDVPGLPLLAGRGTSWRFVALDLELADLRAASRTAGGTVNDGFLAALVGAFRIYHERLGEPLGPTALMPVSAPVSVRREGDPGGGNRIAPARIAGPVGEPDPAERIRLIGAAMRRARSEPALESTELVAPVLSRMPAGIVARLGHAAMAANDLQASNVPGLQHDVYLAGARIERIYGFAPLPGCAAMISMASHGSTLCVGANVDADAITESVAFADALHSGFAEVLALAPGTGTPRSVA